jgi:hypothetical protein
VSIFYIQGSMLRTTMASPGTSIGRFCARLVNLQELAPDPLNADASNAFAASGWVRRPDKRPVRVSFPPDESSYARAMTGERPAAHVVRLPLQSCRD